MSAPAIAGKVVLPTTENIPLELRQRPQWVAWQWSGDEKLPVDPNSGELAKVNDASTWGTFEEACDHAQQRDLGIGFVFCADDPYVGIDFDDLRDPESEEITLQDFERISALGSYTEISPSGTGVKVILKAKLEHAHKKTGLEVYPRGRFFTVTGQHLPGTVETIEGRQTELETLIAEEFGTNGHRAGLVPEAIQEHGRNNTLTSLAGSMRQRGLGQAVIETALLDVNGACPVLS